MGKKQGDEEEYQMNQNQKLFNGDQLNFQVPMKKQRVKLIGKQTLDIKQKKKKIKLGRPILKKKLQQFMKYNETDLIKYQLLKFLASIGYKEGLIFNQKQRNKLKTQQQKNSQQLKLPCISWDDKHEWHKNEQQYKISETIQRINLPKLFKDQKFYTYLLDIGDIFPRQVTSQIYYYLCMLCSFAIKNKNKNKHESNKQKYKQKQNQQSGLIQFVDSLVDMPDGLIFMTGRFTTLYTPACQFEQIKQKLQKMSKNIIKLIVSLILA